GNCDLSIVQLTKAAAPAEPSLADLAAIVAPPAIDDDMPSFAALAETGTKDAPVRAPVAAVPAAPRREPAVAAPVLVDEIEDRRTGPEDRRGAAIQSIRVDLDKVDRVVNMVGELVITQSMLTQQMDDTLRARYQELVRGLEVLAQ